MTRPNSLVLDGSEVKLRLEAERTAHQSVVHVDWVRFTCLLRNVVPTFKTIDELLPSFTSMVNTSQFGAVQPSAYHFAPGAIQRETIAKTLKDFINEHRDPVFVHAMQQAHELALEVCGILGSEFKPNPTIKNGHDFYKYRWSIERNGSECGWVGFLASGDSPRQQAQACTIHANLYGAACTFADAGWNTRMADLVDRHAAKLTRADLALDFFHGLPGRNMENVKEEYLAGLMNAGGKKLKCRMVGDWANGAERSFYIGSKEAGKETNVYEKGDQLFGPESDSPWVRIELRYGNKLRVLPSDMLRFPADFFAGASDWHSLQIKAADAIVSPAKVTTEKRLALESVKAEVTRSLRWALNTAAPTLAALVKFASESSLFEVCTEKKLPGRLQKFNDSELSSAFKTVFSNGLHKKPFHVLKDAGTEATFSIFSVGGVSPALS